MRIKKEIYVCAAVLLCCGLVGCGKADTGSDDFKESEEVMSEMPEDETEDIRDDAPAAVERETDTVKRTGDTISWSNYYGQSIEYTLNHVEMADNLSAFDVERKDMTQLGSERVKEDGTISEEGNIFVAVDVSIRNIDYPGMPDETGVPYILFVENLLNSESLLKENITNLGSAVYFSEHSDSEKTYFSFVLEPEKELQAKLIWIIPEASLKEPVYYIIGSSTGRDTYQYFLLNEER